jgi:hypothetical protein
MRPTFLQRQEGAENLSMRNFTPRLIRCPASRNGKAPELIPITGHDLFSAYSGIAP